MNFPVNISFPFTVSYPVGAYYPGQFIPPDATPIPTPIPTVTYHADTLSWRDRTSIAGSTISDNHLMALNTFVERCYDLGLRDRTGNNHLILDLMPFMGSNLGGALTKLWFLPTAPTVNNYFFGEADYSNSTGITTNGGKYLESNIYPSQNLDINSVSVGVYSLANVPSEGADFSADIANFNLDLYSRLLIHNPYTDNTIYFDAGNVTAGRTTANTNGDTKGLVVGSRVAANNTKIFRRGLQIGQSTVSAGQFPNVNLQLLVSSVAKSYGLIFVGKGIPEEKQAALNNLVHNLMSVIGRDLSVQPTPATGLHADTISWRDRAVEEGGIINNNTLFKVNEFVEGCISDNIYNLLVEVGVFAGDNLPACLTKLKFKSGSPGYLTNYNFVATDYNKVSGLQGDGVSKYLETGATVADSVDPSNFGLSVYCLGSDQATVIGAEKCIMAQNFGGMTYYNTIDNSNTQYVFTDNTSNALYSFNNGAFYRNGSLLANNPDTICQDLVTVKLFARQQQNVIDQYTNRKLIFYAITKNKTALQEQFFYNRVQALQLALNRQGI